MFNTSSFEMCVSMQDASPMSNRPSMEPREHCISEGMDGIREMVVKIPPFSTVFQLQFAISTVFLFYTFTSRMMRYTFSPPKLFEIKCPKSEKH